MPVDVVLGSQRGDEGKGKIVDLEAELHDIVARPMGGSNAGHTVSGNGIEVGLHQIPSGILNAGKLNLIGNGCYIDPIRLRDEMDELAAKGVDVNPSNLVISDAAHLVLPHHVCQDELREAGSQAQGSTKRGIAQVAADKYARLGVRTEEIFYDDLLYDRVMSELEKVADNGYDFGEPLEAVAKRWMDSARLLEPYLNDTVQLINDKLGEGQTVLAEGAQAYLLDIEHGMYPYVTSSHTTISGVMSGLGISHHHLGRVVGVAKALKSHVGGGPFVTEIADEVLTEQLRGPRGQIDSEYGVSSKRPRRIGYLDLVELRSANRVNGFTELALTKLDYLTRYGGSMLVAMAYQCDDELLTEAPQSARSLEQCIPVYEEVGLWQEDISGIKDFADLPTEAQKLVQLVEETVEVDVQMIGVGPGREQIIRR